MDFSFMGPMLFSCLWAMIIFGFIQLFFHPGPHFWSHTDGKPFSYRSVAMQLAGRCRFVITGRQYRLQQRCFACVG